ncbi:AAA family ATPase [Microbacterium sp. WCS2018Hpa-23]|uniref:ATP-dependent nuclease n=1 Tax=Microbacterium sp. WCS2018Hpa-23 TaxID=3073634 RepID=UPI002882D948|nr:AAA family ATPase [Microbacterium sp. WCS2018Hpa-23]
MQFVELSVENFRGLKEVTIPLSKLGCLIGENNSGKSSVLQAILLLMPSSTRRPRVEEFYDSGRPIRVELLVQGVTDVDLARIKNEKHRADFSGVVEDGTVRLVRSFSPGESGKSQLLISQRVPREERWHEGTLAELVRGKRGADLREAVIAVLPELDDALDARPTQTTVKAARDAAVAVLPEDELELGDRPLPTGIDAAIKDFLPEPIYVEAVKDVSDEVKTSESATFGKLIGILMAEIEDQLGDVEKQFREIQSKLSRVVGEDGVESDTRIDRVKDIESTIAGFVRQSFPGVDLKIHVPVPKVRSLINSAEIVADDGHTGPIVSKGDGLKRAVTFAILRAYAELRTRSTDGQASHPGYWLLFEEPELYLHPHAQRQLFAALRTFAEIHSVMVTTHSPLFFEADATETLIKMRKIPSAGNAAPFAEALPVRLADNLPAKTAFQIVCHENNSIGFFAKRVVLVEGDSDAVILPMLAKLLNPEWDAAERNISFARVQGKSNIQSYRTFFANFHIPVSVVCDLDVITDGFERVSPGGSCKATRDALLEALDELTSSDSNITAQQVRDLERSGETRKHLGEARLAHHAGDTAAAIECLERVFAYVRRSDRLESLIAPAEDGHAAKLKSALLQQLADEGCHVLSRGAIEAYYASKNEKRDKVNQAVAYRASRPTLDSYRTSLGESADDVVAELSRIFGKIFA